MKKTIVRIGIGLLSLSASAYAGNNICSLNQEQIVSQVKSDFDLDLITKMLKEVALVQPSGLMTAAERVLMEGPDAGGEHAAGGGVMGRNHFKIEGETFSPHDDSRNPNNAWYTSTNTANFTDAIGFLRSEVTVARKYDNPAVIKSGLYDGLSALQIQHAVSLTTGKDAYFVYFNETSGGRVTQSKTMSDSQFYEYLYDRVQQSDQCTGNTTATDAVAEPDAPVVPDAGAYAKQLEQEFNQQQQQEQPQSPQGTTGGLLQ